MLCWRTRYRHFYFILEASFGIRCNESYQAAETVNGKIFNTSVLRKLQLYPEQAGDLVIDPMHLHNSIEFEDSINREKTVIEKELHSEPVAIRVKALPAKRPDNHTGAVGKFSIQARLDGKTIAAGQQGKLVISISGRGNFIQFGPPVVNWPGGWDVFEPVITDKIQRAASPAEGKREYSFGFTADSAGVYRIPSIAFSYFDTDSGKFRIIHTDTISITINEAVARQAAGKENTDKGSVKDRWIWLSALTAAVAVLLLIFLWRKRRVPAAGSPELKKESWSQVIAALDIASLSDKQACLEIHKQLAALAKEYPGMKAEENGELSAIGRECQLMVYSSIEAPGKKEELKERTLQLARKLEQDHSAYL